MALKRILVPTKIISGTICGASKEAFTVMCSDHILYRITDQAKKQLENFEDIKLGAVVSFVYIKYTNSVMMAFPFDCDISEIHIPSEMEVSEHEV